MESLVIAGKKFTAATSDTVTNPYTGKTIAQVPQAGADAVEVAIAASALAFESYRHAPAHEKSALLSAISAGLSGCRQELGETITAESGKPITLSLAEVDRAVTTFSIAAEEALRIGGEMIPTDTTPAGEGYTAITRRVPVGPVSAISPFNFPLNLVAHKVAPALAAGCPVILKPPVQTPLTPLMLAEIVTKVGAPDGLFTVLPCGVDAARPLITDPRMAMLSFTGSGKVGWYLKSLAGKKRVALELGGNAACIVCEGVDLEATAQRIAFGAFAYAGQVCISVQRVFIQESVYDKFVEELVKATNKVVSGDPEHPDTVSGPLIDPLAADRVMDWVNEAVQGGAKILAGGGRDGNVIRPTLLAGVNPALKVCCEEVFGPVAVVAPFTGFEDAVRQVNDSPYGLQAGVFSPNLADAMYAHRHLDVGGVVVGDIPTLRFDHLPYGGVKESGLGREGVKDTIAEMTEPRLMLIKES